MKAKSIHGAIALCVLVSCGVALAAPRSGPRARSDGWVDILKGGNWTGWRLPTMDWVMAGEVTVSPENGKMLAWTPGAEAIVNGPAGRTINILTKLEHGDAEVHIEFMVPEGSNSGVYLQARYEIQVFDSWGVDAPKSSDCGGIYERWKDGKGYEGRPPRVNASKKPGEWQTFDIVFRAPRFDSSGHKTANAMFVKVTHNGVVIHENQEVTGPTRAATFENDEKPLGPIMLQGDHGPVAYRNIRIRPLATDIEIAAAALLPASTLDAIAKYEFGTTRTPIGAFEEAARGAAPEVVALAERRLIDLLDADSTTFAGKQVICRILRRYGTRQAVSVLTRLLYDEKLSHMARFALERLPGPRVDGALREALDKLTGDLRIGVAGTIGVRKDVQAVPALAKLATGEDKALAAAAISAIGKIGGADAAAALEAAKVADELKPLVADACLLCADAMLAEGKVEDATALYTKMADRRQPTMVRVAAYRGIALSKKEAAVADLVPLLSDRNLFLRRAALQYLGELPGPEATKAIGAQLASGSAETQMAILDILARRGCPAASPAVTALLSSDDAGIRVAAIRTLGAVGGADAVAPLARKAAAGGDEGKAALESLSRLSADGVDAALAGIFEKSDDAATRAGLLEVIAARREAGALATAKAAAKDREAAVRKAAISILAAWPTAEPMADLLAIAKAEGDAGCKAAALGGYLRMLAGAGRPADELRKPFEAAAAIATDADSKKALLAGLSGVAVPWALEMAKTYRDDASVKTEADAAYAKIFGELNKMAILGETSVLDAKDAKIHGSGAQYEPADNRKCIGVWNSTNAWVSWDVRVETPGTFEVEVSQSMADQAGSVYVVEMAGQSLEGTVRGTGDWARFVGIGLGELKVEKAGTYPLAVKVTKKPGTYVMNLRSVTLRRKK
ncbi:MAG: DUF1080 domain-containing protein [Planctomycetes bacterium]|nr:DUF1080 domain-containing protein [Planctomycetota bacterium]